MKYSVAQAEEDRKRRLRESRRKSDQRKREEGKIRKSVWVPAVHEAALEAFVAQLNAV
jgi:hypothetical protein